MAKPETAEKDLLAGCEILTVGKDGDVISTACFGTRATYFGIQNGMHRQDWPAGDRLAALERGQQMAAGEMLDEIHVMLRTLLAAAGQIRKAGE